MSEVVNIGERVEMPPESQDEEVLAINFLEAMRIHAKDKFDKPKFSLYKNDVGFAPLGNIMAICAEAKNGKSWLMMQFACAILNGEFCGLTSTLENRRTMYFDTEQDHYDVKMIQNRVHYVCGWQFSEDNDLFRIYAMDVFDKMKPEKTVQENRLLAIRAGIEFYKPSVIFIDGVRDLIEDFNDLTQSANLVQELMSMARRNGCLIVTVLHVNPNSDKMRGHLGTEMQNKTTDVMTVKKEEQGGIKVFKVHQVAARHMDIDDWTFYINDKGPFPIPELWDSAEVIDSKPDGQRFSNAEIKSMVESCIEKGEELSKMALRERIRKKYKIGATPAGEVVNTATTNRVLVCMDNKYSLADQSNFLDEGDEADPF